MKKRITRLIAIGLSVGMLFSLVPANTVLVYADTSVEGTDLSADEETDPVAGSSDADTDTEPTDDLTPVEETEDLSEENANENVDEHVDDSAEDDSAEKPTEEEAKPVTNPFTGTYDSFIFNLKILEDYADSYVSLHAGEAALKDATELVVNFIRSAKPGYTGGNWDKLCGEEIYAFTEYVKEQDKANGTDASGLRYPNVDREDKVQTEAMGKFPLPSGEYTDFMHMFAVMNLSYTMGLKSTTQDVYNGFADLSGWAGDIGDMLLQTVRDSNYDPNSDIETMTRYIYDNLVGFEGERNTSGMAKDDLIADLDAMYILREQKNTGARLSGIMESYFATNPNMKSRVDNFMEIRFPGLKTQEEIRTAVENAYTNNITLQALESTRELMSYATERKACCYAFADYVYGLYGTPEFDLKAGDLEKGQSLADSELTGTASFFGREVEGTISWADSSMVPEKSDKYPVIFMPADTFHYAPSSTTVAVIVDGQPLDPEDPGENPDTPEFPDVPDEPEEPEERPVYESFSIANSTLAPGVEQSIQYATNADGQQLVFYLATADVSRDDVRVCANYHDNDPSKGWAMQSVYDQMTAAKKRHSNPEDTENYIENYTPVAGINGDYFNMSTGEPGGLLVMEGKTYKEGLSGYMFAILEDGSALIGGNEEYRAHKDEIREAIVGGGYLIKNGEIVTTSKDPASRVSMTAVGIKEDGSVMFAVFDGRQLPFSAGATFYEIATIMKDAGCVEAIHLDGGGSTTYVAKEEGADDISIVNRPSDGFGRQVSDSLMIVSTAKNSNEFSYAKLSSDYTYVMPGSQAQITATGVSETGNSAPLPENTEWVVEDPSLGEISEDGCFTAYDFGDSVVNLMADGEVIGSTTIHVVLPDELEFDTQQIVAIYNDTTKLHVYGKYQGNTVFIPDNTEDVIVELEYDYVGEVNDMLLTAYDEDCGRRTSYIYAYLASDEDLYCESVVYFYKKGEAFFDFDTATSGDRKLAWTRTITNAESDDGTNYHVVDPNKEMQIEYTFALDLNYLSIPEDVGAALPLLAGYLGSQVQDASAWELLLSLAERISPSTTVNVSVEVGPDIELDFSEMNVSCQYFEVTNMDYNKETGVLDILFNWINCDGPIDYGTANPLCIITGITGKPAADAAWDQDNKLNVVTHGSIDYKARLRSSAAFALASGELGAAYGLVPYDNSKNLPGDAGAEFANTHIKYEDPFTLDKTNRNGWVSDGDVGYYYYIDNEKVNGIQYLTEPTGNNQYYYYFNETGAWEGKYTGFVEKDNATLYAVNGTPVTDWREIDGAYYYFNEDGSAQTGTATIKGIEFEFDNTGKLKSGVWVTKPEGTRYYYGPSYYLVGGSGTVAFYEIDGATYGFDKNGYRYEGINAAKASDGIFRIYEFDSEGKFIGPCDVTGIVENFNGDKYYAENGLCTYQGLVVEYYDEAGNLVDTEDEAWTAVYYYFGSNYKAARDEDRRVSKINHLLPIDTYHFDDNCQYIIDKRTGIFTDAEDGNIYYYVNGVKTYQGLAVQYYDKAGNLLKSEDGAYKAVYYYFNSSLAAVRNRDYQIYKTNDLLPVGYYPFDQNGQYIVQLVTEPVIKNGIVDENSVLYYYENNERVRAGLIQIDGDYYYIRTGGVVAVNGKYYTHIPNTEETGFEAAYYYFDETGKMKNPKNGIIEEDGNLYYYVDGVKTYQGLVVQYYDANNKLLSDRKGAVKAVYYYFNSSLAAVKGKKYSVYNNNDLLPQGTYYFDENGQYIVPITSEDVKNGIIEEDGNLYYYENDSKIYKGLVVEYYDSNDNLLKGEDGAVKAVYYYFNSSLAAVKGRTYSVFKDNDLLPQGTYYFDENGQHVVYLVENEMKNGIIEEDGNLYYYENDEKIYKGLVAEYYDANGKKLTSADSASKIIYYYFNSSKAAVRDKKYSVYKNNDLLPQGTYYFNENCQYIVEL